MSKFSDFLDTLPVCVERIVMSRLNYCFLFASLVPGQGTVYIDITPSKAAKII